MADIKISAMVAATAAAGADLLPLVQGGTNKKITIAALFAAVNTPVIINQALAAQDTRVAGVTDANLIFANATLNNVGIGTATPAAKLDVAGSLNTNGIVRNQSSGILSVAGAIDLTTTTTLLDTTSSFAATLGAGALGQEKTLISRNTGAVTITAATGSVFNGFTTINMATLGGTVSLYYIDGKWSIVNGFRVSFT